jgi:hypothetical protein
MCHVTRIDRHAPLEVPEGFLGYGSRSNRPQVNSLYYYVFLFNLIICIVNCAVYLIPNQIIALLCCLFNLIICP